MKYFHGIGLMSGTSLDGLDIAYVQFKHDTFWSYEIIACETIKYEPILKQKLHESFNYPALQFQILHHAYGQWIGKSVLNFIQKHKISPQFIASHGHTIFHEPQKGLTTQIGSGANIYAQTGVTTVCDFRSVDVAMGGQGAPLVPIGDQMLFGDFDYLLNLGGIANITINQEKNDIRAFDITIANIALNYYAKKLGAEYDANGDWAKSGVTDQVLLEKLNKLPFFGQSPPKSLGREFFEKEFLPIADSFKIANEDALNTICRHIAMQINNTLQDLPNASKKMIVTGGGALNSFLVSCIKDECKNVEVVIPDRKTVEFKEALIFAFLGVLRLLNQPNCLKSVTGASEDVIGGAVYGNFNVIQ